MEARVETVIGICAVRERARWAFWDQTAHLVADTYVEAIQAAGAHALLLAVDPRAPEALLDRVDGDGNNPHRRVVGTFAGTEHDIDLDPGSLAERAIGEPVHEARCHHHQAIERLGDGLVVSGRARDGVAEAIELSDGRGWALGVQWHPEAGDKRELFEAFVEAAREFSGAASR